jgi:hypothetical protein
MYDPSNPSSTSTDPSNQVTDKSPIGDLMTNLQQLAQAGPGKDFRLSEAGRQQLLNAISTFQQDVDWCINQATKLTNYGHPGTFQSAHNQITNFQQAVNHPINGIVPNLTGYHAYLGKAHDTFNTWCGEVHAVDDSAPPTMAI